MGNSGNHGKQRIPFRDALNSSRFRSGSEFRSSPSQSLYSRDTGDGFDNDIVDDNRCYDDHS